MHAEAQARADIHAVILRLMLRGPVNNRLIWSQDNICAAAYYFGDRQVNLWLREVAQPEQEPPSADTRWRLV